MEFFTRYRKFFNQLFFYLNDLLIYTPLMFLGEFLAGLIICSYQNKFVSENKKQEPTKSTNIEYSSFN